ncbi:hypothetical protein HWV62_35156 [Athelia sp. TMB]|nr:hypothetical protein HWV62_35156 [Athelia sp. TMB]
MCHSWWPASTERPRSAATFTVLKQFQTLSLQGKLVIYDFYKSTELITDGLGVQRMPFCLAQLSLMVREYRHIKMLARASRGHDPAGIAATKRGEIAVHCRAWPQPGINLPEGWETDVENRPDAWPGWATFIDHAPYHEHLKNYIHKDEFEACIYPPYLPFLQHHVPLVCQLVDPGCLTTGGHSPNISREALIGKILQFHLKAHGRKCYARYSLRLTPGVGRVEGEAPERGWSILGCAAIQTKEMGPRARNNILDDICGFSNWPKVVESGNTLLKELVLAITESIYYWRTLQGLEEGLNEEHPGCIARWEVMLAEWERNPSKPCLYDSKELELTVNKVKLQLANEDHVRMGLSTSQPHTPTTFVMLGLELEELQCSLLRDIKAKPKATPLQLVGFQDRCLAVRRKIVYCRTLQVHYMPGLGSVLDEPALLLDDPDALAEAVRLFMP